MFEELKDYIASHTKEEIQEDWKETPEIDFVIDGKVYTPATFECNLDDRGNVWGLVINLELED